MLDINVAVLHAGQMLHHAVNAFKNVTGNIRIFALNHQINRDVVFSVNVNLFTSPKDTMSRLNPGNFTVVSAARINSGVNSCCVVISLKYSWLHQHSGPAPPECRMLRDMKKGTAKPGSKNTPFFIFDNA